jgi:hypothetical protein
MIRSASPPIANCGIVTAMQRETTKTIPDDNRVRLFCIIGNLRKVSTNVGGFQEVPESVKNVNKFARLRNGPRFGFC